MLRYHHFQGANSRDDFSGTTPRPPLASARAPDHALRGMHRGVVQQQTRQMVPEKYIRSIKKTVFNVGRVLGIYKLEEVAGI